MNQARRGSSQTTLMFLVFLVLTTLGFGVLAYLRYSEAEVLRIGNPDGSQEGKPLVNLLNEQNNLVRDIRAREIELRQLQGVAHELDSRLASHRMQLQAGGQVTGNESPAWTRTREAVAFNLSTIQHTADSLGDQPNLFDPLEENQRDFSDRLRDTMQQITDADAKLEEDRDRLDAKLDDLEKAREQAIKEFHNTKSELATEKSRLEARIRELLELNLNWLGEIRPDAEVVEVDLGHDFLIINIGEKDRAFNGLKLEVFQYDKGHFKVKGFVEVIEVRDTFATCRIMDEKEKVRDPITKGDLVGNPLFSTARPPIIVLAGEFKLFNRGDLAAFLRRTGAIVQDQLGPEVDFLIAADRSAPEQDQAREYRVTAMTEAQAVRYLDTSFDPQQ